MCQQIKFTRVHILNIYYCTQLISTTFTVANIVIHHLKLKHPRNSHLPCITQGGDPHLSAPLLLSYTIREVYICIYVPDTMC